MGEVVDVRPDRFLREMREHGDANRACEAAGLAKSELEDLCRSNIKFDRTQVEIHLEYLEDNFRKQLRLHLKAARDALYTQLKARHPDG